MTLEWLPVDTAEADLSPPASEDMGGKTPPHAFRVSNELWRDFGYACEDLGTDRSAYFREFMRWAIHDEGVKMPRRPAKRPSAIPTPEPLPALIKEIEEPLAKPKGATQTRYIIRVDTDLEAVLRTLRAATVATVGLTYHDEQPILISTLDRGQAISMFHALADAGLTLVEP